VERAGSGAATARGRGRNRRTLAVPGPVCSACPGRRRARRHPQPPHRRNVRMVSLGPVPEIPAGASSLSDAAARSTRSPRLHRPVTGRRQPTDRQVYLASLTWCGRRPGRVACPARRRRRHRRSRGACAHCGRPVATARAAHAARLDHVENKVTPRAVSFGTAHPRRLRQRR
jgi:hypothetical protein